MLFMVIESFRRGDARPVGERFRRHGRMMPEGLTYHASWVDLSGTRCFQIMNGRTEAQWRRYSNAVILPEVKDVGWNSFESAHELIEAGEKAARAVLPQILRWLPERSDKTPAVA